MKRNEKCINKVVKALFCHEWGHALTAFLVTDDLDVLESIRFDDIIYEGLHGYNDLNVLYELTKEQYKLILCGGTAAENVCGYSDVVFHRGTDKDYLCELEPNEHERKKCKEKAVSLLRPHKKTLDKLVHETIKIYPDRQEDLYIHFRIFKDEMKKMLIDAMETNKQ